MKRIREIDLCFSLVTIITATILQLLNQASVVGTSAVINCDKYKYNVQHPYQRNYCIPCKICPSQSESRFHNEDCKKKLPDSIPAQGYAWCTGDSDRSPWCPLLTVSNGRLACGTNGNSVYSTCTLSCNSGYTPVHSNLTKLVCLESLQWNITDLSLLRCQRAAKPDKPSISSPGRKQEVKSGSEKTLICMLTSDVIGRQRIHWYFKDKQLPSDSDLNTYVIHGASKDNEGEYFCQVEDDIGKSELSAGYFIKVEENFVDSVWDRPGTVVLVLVAVCVLVLLFILYIKRRECYKYGVALLRRINVCQPHQEGEKINSCLSSQATSVGSSSGTNGTCSTVDFGTSDGEGEQPLISETLKKLQSTGTECQQLTKKEIFNADGKKLCDHPLTKEAPARDVKSTGHKMEFKDIKGASSSDQNDLRLVLKDWKLMKELRTSLDHIADINIDKPTFHSLGRYLGASEDEISHFEFTCRQKDISPTETYIRKMAEEGRGLSYLVCFLKGYKHTESLAKDVENRISYLRHTFKD